MIAALQMYDWPEVQPRIDTFWQRVAAALQDQGINAPQTLSRPDSIASSWTQPDLLLGQTCGLPYVAGRCGEAVLVARPDFGLPGAVDGTYSSALICRSDEEAEDLGAFKGRTAAINEFGSQSGCNALADAVMDHTGDDAPFFGTVLLSGAHRNSACMVADGTSDVAAIDAVAWALFAQLEPQRHAKLRVLGWTSPMPALPFITSKQSQNHIDALFKALQHACNSDGPTPLPHRVQRCLDHEYDPIRAMASRVSGLRLATDVPTL